MPEFVHALLGMVGAPNGRISTYAEVQFRDGDGKLSIPDGAISVERGKTRWCCLVEVKTAGAELTSDQVSGHIDLAREHGLDAVLTISNQITARPEDSPVSVHGAKLKKVALRHLSWWRVITEAVVQHRFRGVSDPDQAWILGELIAYLDHEASGASGFEDMGDKWVSARDAARAGTLRAADPEARAVAQRWEQFVQYVALGLSQDLGREVAVVRGRKESAETRGDALVKQLAQEGSLAGSVRVPDAIAPVSITADLRTRQVMTSVTVDALGEGRPSARINWLLRQRKDASPDLRLEVAFTGARETTSALLGEAREFPHRLLSPTDAKRRPRAFTVTLTRPMGTKRGKGRGSFVNDTKRQAIDFYRELVQNLKPWRASAPKLPKEPEEVPETPQPEPPPFTAPERDAGDAIDPADANGDTRAEAGVWPPRLTAAS